MVATSPYQCLTLSLLILPPLLITTYFMAAFPNPPAPILIHPSLASMPPTSRSWSIYPEDFYSNGGYATFPNGRVRYWLLGPEKGKKVVLIHGLSIPAIVWKDVAPSLAARGYRVLLYDLYGRGYSDAPVTTYDTTLYTTQLALLMQYLKWDKANIVGLSMGGAIAAAFTAHFPHLVDEGVGLIASAGLIEPTHISRTAKFMSSPLVQTLVSSKPVQMYMRNLTDRNATKDVDTSNPVIEIVRLQSAHLPGYNNALSSSLRDGPIRGQAASFQSAGFEGKRVLILHGTEDVTVNPKYAAQIAELLPAASNKKMVIVDGAGHDLCVSHSTDVVDALNELLDGRSWKTS
ncbi:Alpha/Beta hydrolase protein [Gymnopilus junonius]|uniref:Alpha/Beta hydrolase protein n=1 Tax=Gymnopilus junonius TaxID=109634 RepID=A0A9P5TGK9_GYMJU|nr:Alpha/Beta hydrolase protein [Gymnopilus junonius]